MSFALDEKFISLLSNDLQLLKKKKEGEWSCRCPFCGDSETNKLRTRGYFIQGKHGYNFYCHNCTEKCSLQKFLKQIAPNLYKEYQFENFQNTNNYNWNQTTPTPQPKPKQRPTSTNPLEQLMSVDNLPDTHFCKIEVKRI